MEYSHEVEQMCVVAKGCDHGPAPIPEEGNWVKAKDVTDISFDIDKKNRSASVAISFTTDEDRFREEIRIPWQNMA